MKNNKKSLSQKAESAFFISAYSIAALVIVVFVRIFLALADKVRSDQVITPFMEWAGGILGIIALISGIMMFDKEKK